LHRQAAKNAAKGSFPQSRKALVFLLCFRLDVETSLLNKDFKCTQIVRHEIFRKPAALAFLRSLPSIFWLSQNKFAVNGRVFGMRSSWLVGVLVACLVHAAQSEASIPMIAIPFSLHC
jgi:hypothetical protein